MKGFGIEVKNDLLELKHIETMGVSVWLYMWFLDKITSITEEGIGRVLGGKPIVYEDIRDELGISWKTYVRWLNLLKNGGYIQLKRTPHGYVVGVKKAFKRFHKRYAKNDISQNEEEQSDRSKKGGDIPKMGYVSKTVQDSNQRNTATPDGAPPSFPIRPPKNRQPLDPMLSRLIQWAEGTRAGFKFISWDKQIRALKLAKKNNITPNELKNRWAEMEDDSFYSEKGFDWMTVVMSFNKKR